MYRGESRRSRHAAASAALGSVGLTEWAAHTPSELSGGQQQRVAIARAIVTHPLLLLADEPTGNLDTHMSREIMELLAALNREKGITVVMVTHDSEMAAYAKRVVGFIDGSWTGPHEREAALMLWNSILLAVRAIRRNVLRSFLTILGVVIGVGAVIVMVTLGDGATQSVKDQISSLGSNLLMVRPGQRLGPGRDAAGAPNFKVADAEAMASQVGSVAAVAPTTGSTVTVVYQNQNWSTSITGSTRAYFTTGNWRLASGRVFTDAEERAGKAVCVIGETVHRELFGTQDPVGSEIRVKRFSCEVIGLLAAKGSSGMDNDDTVVMPLRTVQRRVRGNDDVTGLQVSVRDGASLSTASDSIKALLRERRKIADNEDDNF